jgi:hypothetical protein
MRLKFVGIDPNTAGGNCPSVWVDELTGDLVLQGWEVTDQTDREMIAGRSPIATNEKIVRLPARVRNLIVEACQTSAAVQG